MNKQENCYEIIETKRLILRPMTEHDAALVVKWRNNPHVSSMNLQATKKLTIEDHLAWFNSSRQNRVDYIIVIKSNKKPIGSVSMYWPSSIGLQNSGESGRYIGDIEELGKGYATEAAEAWIDFAFTKLFLNSVVARTHISNIPNQRINQKLGFKRESFPEGFRECENDWMLMKLEKSQWLSKINK